jgi:hypothetical protein
MPGGRMTRDLRVLEHHEKVRQAIAEKIIVAFKKADLGRRYTIETHAHPGDTQSYYSGYKVEKVSRGYKLIGEGENVDIDSDRPHVFIIPAKNPEEAVKKFLDEQMGCSIDTQEGYEYAEHDFGFTPEEIAESWCVSRTKDEDYA